MRYEITAETVDFYIDYPRKEVAPRTSYSRIGSRLSEPNLHKICNAIVRKAQGRVPGTQRNYLYMFFRPLHCYFLEAESQLPENSRDWQEFIVDFYRFYLTSTTWTDSNVKTRLFTWQCSVKGILKLFIRERIIPGDVTIPSGNHKALSSQATAQGLLGEQDVTSLKPGSEISKLLVSVDFGRDSADYLENIDQQCRQRVNLIQRTCLNHWEALMKDGLAGERLAAEITPTELAASMVSGRCSERITGGPPTPLASPTHPRGLQWALAVAKHLLATGNHTDCISTETLSTSGYFSAQKSQGFRFEHLFNLTSMPASAYSALVAPVRFCRFAGVLSMVDVAAACCLLTIEHPEFTADSLHSAKLLNSRGQRYVLLTDDSTRNLFSVDKPRAGSRKVVALTPLAQRLIQDIITWTAPVRTVLRNAANKGWRYLFLGYGRGGTIKALVPYAHHLWSPSKVSLARLYPELPQSGLTEGTFDFRRIRTTMGVLRWFETGSIREMSRTMGNTTKVVLENYLPAALLLAWNSRIIRRFQNTLIWLAAYEESYLLEVTDFTSISDLQHFLAQLILEYPNNSSPLANELHSRFNQLTPCLSSERSLSHGEGLLNVRLSAPSLAYLYAFSDYAVNTLTLAELESVDLQTNLNPSQFVDLARLIQHACESEQLTASLREILDVPRLREVHLQAKVQQIAIREKLSKLSIKRQWERLDA